MYYYKDGAFYHPSVFPVKPSGAVEITDQAHAEMMEGQSSGKEIVTDSSGSPKLEGRKKTIDSVRIEKYAEIEAAYAEAETTPVSVNGWRFKGGFSSGIAIDAQRRMIAEYAESMPELGITTVDLFDVDGKRITLPLSSKTELDALDVTLSIGFATSSDMFKYAEKRAAIKAAKTVKELQEISW